MRSILHQLASAGFSLLVLFPCLLQGSDSEFVLPEESHFFRSPELLVPATETAFQIDGELSDAEKAASAELRSFFTFAQDARTDERMTVYLAHTGAHLYVGFQIRRPGGEEPRAEAEEPSQSILWQRDDSLEIRILSDDGGYDFIGNAAGIAGDARIGAGSAGTDLTWTHPDWQYAARKTDDGWQGEFLIGAAAIGLEAFEEGQRIRIDFFNNSKTEPVQGGWAYQAGLWRKDYELFPRIVMGGKDSLYQDSQQLGLLDGNRAGLSAVVKNPASAERSAKVWTAFHRRKPDTESRNFFSQLDGVLSPQEIEIRPGATFEELLGFALESIYADYTFLEETSESVAIPGTGEGLIELRKPDLPGDYIVAWQFLDEESGLPISAGVYPFSIAPPLQTDFEYHYLTAEEIVVRTLISDDIARKAGTVDYTIFHDGKPIAEQTVGDLQGGVILETVFSTSDWPPGEYVLDARAADGGSIIAKNKTPFLKPEPPFWWNSDAGKQIEVSWPWTPVDAKPEEAAVWGRVMNWGKGVVPEKITTQGKELFSSSPRLIATINGETRELDWKRFDLVSAAPGAAVYEGESSFGSLVLHAKTTVEFDGMMRFDWTFSSKDGESANVEQLFLEFPVETSVADLLAVGGDQRMEMSGSMPLGDTALAFNPSVILRNSRVGLEWFAECEQHWSNNTKDQLIDILPGPDAVTLRIRFIDKPTTIDAPRTITWGLIAWPVKPWPEQRFNLVNYPGNPPAWMKEPGKEWDYWEDGIPATIKFGTNIIEYFHWNALDRTPCYPEFYNEEIKERVTRVAEIANEHGIPIVGHTAYALPTDTEDFQFYGREMMLEPVRNHGRFGYAFTATSAYIDAYVTRYKKIAEETGWSGLQSDGGLNPRYSENERAGFGWRDEDGNLRGRWPVFAFRELARRLYNVFHGEVDFPALPNGFGHVTLHTYYPFGAVCGFVDSLHTGESRRSWGSFEELDRETERALYPARSLGVPLLCLSKLDKVQHGGRGRIAFALMYGMNPMGNRILQFVDQKDYEKESYPLHLVWEALEWVDAHPEQFHGYWENEHLVEFDKEDFFASVYLQTGEKALIAVINWQPEDRNVMASLNLEAMQFNGGIVMEDAITGERFEAVDGRLNLETGGDGYRLIKIWTE